MYAACLRVDAARHGAVDEDGALLGHLLGLLLAHRAAQQVRAAERVAGQHLRDLHHLFLVQDHAVGRLRAPASARDAGSRSAVAAVPCLRLMKSSTMPDCSGPGRNSATSATMSSKRSGCRRRIRSFMPRDSSWNTAVVRPDFSSVVGRRVVHRQRVDVERRLAALARIAIDDLHGPVDDGERAQAQEVELDQARGLDVVLVELRDHARRRRLRRTAA